MGSNKHESEPNSKYWQNWSASTHHSSELELPKTAQQSPNSSPLGPFANLYVGYWVSWYWKEEMDKRSPFPFIFFSSFVWFLLYIDKQLLLFQHSSTKHSFSTYSFQHKVGDFGVSYKNESGMTSSFKDSKMSKQPVQVQWQHWEEVNTGIAFPEVRSTVYFNVVQVRTLQPKDSNSADFFYKETIEEVSKIHTKKVIPALFPAVVKSSAHIRLQRKGG